MEENKTYKIGDFEYELKEGSWSYWDYTRSVSFGPRLNATKYIGPTGPGSVAHLLDRAVVEGIEKLIYEPSQLSLIKNQSIEKIINATKYADIVDIPTLKEYVQQQDYPVCCKISNCPLIERIVIENKVDTPVELKTTHGHVMVEYHNGIKLLDQEVAGDDIHIIFGDEVEDVGIIRGGHVTLGKGVKEIQALKKADFGLRADTTIAEYEFPTRIDFATVEPPVVRSVAPGSMTVAELHVPAGSLDAYISHPQWGKATYFVEEGGKTVDKYAAKHKARLKKLQKEREEAAAKAAEKAKADKIKAMGGMMHSTLAAQRLAKWNPDEVTEWSDSIKVHVTVGCLEFDINIPKDSPIDIWDKIVAKLEEIESNLTK